MTAGVVQVGLQWLCFTFVCVPSTYVFGWNSNMECSFVLYMIYYPEHLKYVELDLERIPLLPPIHVKTPVKSDEWRISIIVSWIAAAHLYAFFPFMLRRRSAHSIQFLHFNDDHVPPCHFTGLTLRESLSHRRCVGHLPWCKLRYAGYSSIRATTIPHVSNEARGRTQHPDDDDSDPGRNLDGDEYCPETWDELDK